jgi:hypothetical protein
MKTLQAAPKLFPFYLFLGRRREPKNSPAKNKVVE